MSWLPSWKSLGYDCRVAGVILIGLSFALQLGARHPEVLEGING